MRIAERIGRTNTLPVVAMAIAMAGGALAETQPYAGQEQRAIASLSAQDIEDLTEGRGWGFAKSAELNGLPGPAHILELSEVLDLTDDQKMRIEAIFAAMNAEARRLGRSFIAAEAALDAAFESGAITAQDVEDMTAEAGRLRSALRAVHLQAHLEAAPVLTRHQTMIYNRERGYQSGDGHGAHAHN